VPQPVTVEILLVVISGTEQRLEYDERRKKQPTGAEHDHILLNLPQAP
jgi:hypothetical protein